MYLRYRKRFAKFLMTCMLTSVLACCFVPAALLEAPTCNNVVAVNCIPSTGHHSILFTGDYLFYSQGTTYSIHMAVF
jgi:hypothetical protein